MPITTGQSPCDAGNSTVILQQHLTLDPLIRELELGPGGIRVGQALTRFQGVLTGVPTFLGGQLATSAKPEGTSDAVCRG